MLNSEDCIAIINKVWGIINYRQIYINPDVGKMKEVDLHDRLNILNKQITMFNDNLTKGMHDYSRSYYFTSCLYTE